MFAQPPRRLGFSDNESDHMTSQRAVIAVILALSSPAWAQEAPPAATTETTVEVSGVKNPALRPYRIMSRGLDAFDKHHALAPGGDLRFELWNADGTIPQATGLGLRLAGDTVDLKLPVDGDATFVLPRSQAAFDDNADLVVNRKKEQMRWRPRVRSAGLSVNTRRLGDMRLECEVSWAVMKDELSFVVRTALAAAGGLCHAPVVKLQYRAPMRLSAATLTSGERSAPLTLVMGGSAYVVPLRDTSWNDDSLITYVAAPGARDDPATTPKEQGAEAP